jgi:drug/metabolite transporter (DMT)-like permease
MFCALMMLGMPLSFLAASRHASTGAVLTVFWVSPWLALAASRVAGEQMGASVVAAALCGWVGSLFLQGAELPRSLVAWAAALVMALCFAGYLVGMRRLATEAAPAKLFYTAAGVLVPLTLAVSTFRMPDRTSLAAMSLIGVLGLAGLFALDRALELAPASIVAPVMFLQPALAQSLESWPNSLLHDGARLGGLALGLAGLALLLIHVRLSSNPDCNRPLAGANPS